jgi:cell division protein FtsA
VLSPTRRKQKNRDQVCILDLGSHTLRAAVFSCGLDGQPPEVLGVARRSAEGIGAGAVIDLPALSSCIAALLEQLEHMADTRVSRVVVVVSHPSIALDRAVGMASVSGQLVQPKDCRRAEEAARQRFNRRRQRLVHEAVQGYRLDGRSYREKPHALKGQRVEVEVQHLSLCEATLNNLVRAVRAAKVQVEAICSNILATAASALSDDERQAGVALLEMGAETCSSSVYAEGELIAARCQRGGGRDLTLALSRGLLVPLKNAEKVKVSSALALSEMADEQQLVEVETIGLRDRRELPRRAIAEAIEPTLQQQLQGLASLVSETGMASQLSAGLVLAGNGAQIEGLVELAERSLSVPVRVAQPRALVGLAELVDQPGDCALVGAALLWSRNELPSWESPERRARAKRNTQPRWFDLLM